MKRHHLAAAASGLAISACLALAGTASADHLPECDEEWTPTSESCHLGGGSSDNEETFDEQISPYVFGISGGGQTLFTLYTDEDRDGNPEAHPVTVPPFALTFGPSHLSLTYTSTGGTNPGAVLTHCPSGQSGLLITGLGRVSPNTEIVATFTDPMGNVHTQSHRAAGGKEQGVAGAGICAHDAV